MSTINEKIADAVFSMMGVVHTDKLKKAIIEGALESFEIKIREDQKEKCVKSVNKLAHLFEDDGCGIQLNHIINEIMESK